MEESIFLSSALNPLISALVAKWERIPVLREMLSKLGQPQDDVAAYLTVHETIQTDYIHSLFAAHAACEALINCTLAIALKEANKPEVFHMLEKASFLDKWETAPKIVNPSYAIDTSTALHQTLNRINAHRNSYLHNKASLTIGGELIFEGSKSLPTSFDIAIDWIHRYISLPFDLAEHLRKYKELLIPAITLRRGVTKRAPQHKP